MRMPSRELSLAPSTDPEAGLRAAPVVRSNAPIDDEASLVRRARSGDDDAFAALYTAHRDSVLAACVKVLRDRDAAEDIAQETFLRAHACLDRYDDRRPLGPWLRSIAVRRCIDLLRHTERSVSSAEIEEHLPFEPESDPTLGAVIALEDRGKLERALRRLHPRQRRALLLNVLEGWSYAEIAEVEGVSVGATKSLIFHARANLRRACRRGLYATIVAGLMALRRRVARRATTMESRLTGSIEPIASSFAPVSSGIAAVVLSLITVVTPSLAVAPSGLLATSPSGTGASGLSSPAGSVEGRSASAGRTRGLMGSLLNPTKNATPEQTQFTSIATSPNYEDDHTLFASGNVACPQTACAVLFASRDGGRSWQRMPTQGFNGTTVFLPPNYPADRRIFAMGDQGLQISEDGSLFKVVLPITGDTAISPLFDGSDPRLVIGATVVTEYWADKDLPKPATLIGPSGQWMTVTFSPQYATDHVLYVGGVRPDAAGRTLRPTVNRCTDSICESVVFDTGYDAPFVRTSTDFAHDRTVYAFTPHVLFRSTDAGSTFAASEPTFAARATIKDVQILRDGTTLVALSDAARTNGLYRSVDGGKTWRMRTLPVSGFRFGVRKILVLPDGRLIALGAERGIACSHDGGWEWSSRCGA
jgi:RNA polymerase sigma-70 factor, ECF subfamily